PGILSGETKVTTEFPKELVPMAGFGEGWFCTPSNQVLACNRIGQLAPDGAFPRIRLRAFVRLGPTPVTVVTTVGNTADVNPSNNTAADQANTVVPDIGLDITKVALNGRVAIGGVAAYEIRVTNIGASNVNNAVVKDLLPRGFVLVKGSPLLAGA